MKNKDLTDPTLSIQEQKRIAIEILRQYHRWEMANPRPPPKNSRNGKPSARSEKVNVI
ncbi:hypothetical protein [Serratia ureilytica]